ncbi:hypothetical protein [Campylobacter jejuni]|nr:hypothetical protein [Campylobacter jejuni]
MSELKRNKTSFTGVYGSENMNNLAKIKDEKNGFHIGKCMIRLLN